MVSSNEPSLASCSEGLKYKMQHPNSDRKAKGKANAKNPPQKSKASKPRGPRQSGAAVAYATQQVGKAPQIEQRSADTCRIRHREFIGNVTGSVAFAIANTFSINPGLAGTFPWLSVMAQAWETYRFRNLRFCYYTRTGTNVPGSVILAVDPDASDAAPSNEQIMSTYEHVMEDAPWKDIMMAMKRAVLTEVGPKRFVRQGALAANQDIKLYDVGTFFVGTVDGTAVSWGKLWVEYDIDLFTPQLPPAGVIVASVATNATGTGATAVALLGTPANVTITGPLIVSVDSVANLSKVVLQNLVVGNEYFIFASTLATVSTGNLAATLFANLVGLTLKTDLGSPISGSANPYSDGCSFTATANSGSFNMVFATLTTPTRTAIWIVPVPTVSI